MLIAESVSKFSGLSWFLLLENVYNGEGSLQANKTSNKQKLNLNSKEIEELQSYNQFL